jgi:hypothetical protein
LRRRLRGLWEAKMEQSNSRPLIDKLKGTVEYVLLFLLIFLASDWLGNKFSSYWLNFSVGFLFYPTMNLLPPKSWQATDFDPHYLGLKHRNLPLWASLVFVVAAICLFIIAVSGPPASYKSITFSGAILWIAIEQLKMWLKVKNVSVQNE